MGLWKCRQVKEASRGRLPDNTDRWEGVQNFSDVINASPQTTPPYEKHYSNGFGAVSMTLKLHEDDLTFLLYCSSVRIPALFPMLAARFSLSCRRFGWPFG